MTKIIMKEGLECELRKKVPHLLMILESYINYCSFAYICVEMYGHNY